MYSTVLWIALVMDSSFKIYFLKFYCWISKYLKATLEGLSDDDSYFTCKISSYPQKFLVQSRWPWSVIITISEICPNGSGKGWENIGTGSLEEVFALYLSQGQLGVSQQGKERKAFQKKKTAWRKHKWQSMVGTFRAYLADDHVELENRGLMVEW